MSDAFSFCETLVREADKDRYLATLFAPSAARPALYALFAFDLELRRIGTLSGPMPGEIRLQWWRDVLGGERSGEAEANPVAQALLTTRLRHALPPGLLQGLIEARTFDAYDDPMPGLADLHRYVDQTSCALLGLAARILGGGGPEEAALVHDGGIAIGFVELLRGFPDHARRRKLYVPRELLQRHGAGIEEVFAGHDIPALRQALADMRQHARSHLDAARAALDGKPRRSLPAFLPLALTRRWLDRLERAGPFEMVDIPQWRRQWVLWRAARAGLSRAL